MPSSACKNARREESLFQDAAPNDIYTLSLHDALPILGQGSSKGCPAMQSATSRPPAPIRSEEHTSELQSRPQLVCRLRLVKTPEGKNLFFRMRRPTTSTLFPYTTLFRSWGRAARRDVLPCRRPRRGRPLR